AALAVGLAMVAMHLTKSFHPPAGIDPLVVVLHDMSWSFLLVPVAVGACLLAALAFVWHNRFRGHGWPERWWGDGRSEGRAGGFRPRGRGRPPPTRSAALPR